MVLHSLRRALKARKTVLVCVMLSLCFVAGITLARLGSFASTTKLINQADTTVDDSGLVNIYATISGFEPAEITVRAGENIVMIRNRTGQGDQVYSLVPAVTQGSSDEPLSLGSAQLGAKVRTRLTLTPGEFLLREANNPDWVCRITVVP
ncbi:MAG: hypothetical protein AB1489_13670 [Acidobacteriota bacterium]